MRDGVVIRYADDTVSVCNAAAERILGLTADEMTAGALVRRHWRTVHEVGSAFDPCAPPRG